MERSQWIQNEINVFIDRKKKFTNNNNNNEKKQRK